MNSYIIKLRNSCTKEKIRMYVNQFFRRERFAGRYISVQLKFHTNDNNIDYIGSNYLLNIKKPTEVAGYKLFIDINYINYIKNNSNDSINQVIFSYKPITRKEYLEHKTTD